MMNNEYMPQGDLKKITGVVVAIDEDEDGNKCISVKKFRVIE